MEAGGRTRREPLILVKGAGDVGSAVAQVLHAAGYAVVLVEGADPSTARRGMSFAEAIFVGRAELEDVVARRVSGPEAALDLLAEGQALPVLVGEPGAAVRALAPAVTVDARMRKREQPEAQLGEAALTVGLGPGFRAGETTDLIVETNWGPNLGLVLEHGECEAYTGQPRAVLGYARERYSYAPRAGLWRSELAIGAAVRAGQTLGTVDGEPLRAAIDGVVRGLTRDGVRVATGAKVADVDPRGEQAETTGITERPRRIADGVLRAIEARYGRPGA